MRFQTRLQLFALAFIGFCRTAQAAAPSLDEGYGGGAAEIQEAEKPCLNDGYGAPCSTDAMLAGASLPYAGRDRELWHDHWDVIGKTGGAAIYGSYNMEPGPVVDACVQVRHCDNSCDCVAEDDNCLINECVKDDSCDACEACATAPLGDCDFCGVGGVCISAPKAPKASLSLLLVVPFEEAFEMYGSYDAPEYEFLAECSQVFQSLGSSGSSGDDHLDVACADV